jgi:hypothetical protein
MSTAKNAARTVTDKVWYQYVEVKTEGAYGSTTARQRSGSAFCGHLSPWRGTETPDDAIPDVKARAQYRFVYDRSSPLDPTDMIGTVDGSVMYTVTGVGEIPDVQNGTIMRYVVVMGAQ